MSCPACRENRDQGRQYCPECGEMFFGDEERGSATIRDADTPRKPKPPEPKFRSRRRRRLSVGVGLVLLLIAEVLVFFAVRHIREVRTFEQLPEPDAVVLAEDDCCKIWYHGIQKQEGGWCLRFTLKNTTNRTALLRLAAGGYDGYATFGIPSSKIEKLARGEQRSVSYEISERDLGCYGIETFQTLMLQYAVLEEDFKELSRGDIWFDVDDGAPAGERARPARIEMEQEQTVCDADGVRLIFGKPQRTPSGGLVMRVYFENDTGAPVWMFTENLALNETVFQESGGLEILSTGVGYGVFIIPDFIMSSLDLEPTELCRFDMYVKLRDEARTMTFSDQITYTWE